VKKNMAPSRKEIFSKTGETPEIAIGEMLRHAREEQGLDYLQLSEMTKLQPHVLESLENEEWFAFSAPVFIKGFLRSYAKALNLDEGIVLRMYDETNPGVNSVPTPLASLAPSRRRTPAFFVVLVLLAACTFFAVHYYTSTRHTAQQLHVVEPADTAVAPAPKQTESPVNESSPGSEHAEEAETTPETGQKELEAEKHPGVQDKQSTGAAVEQKEPIPEISAPKPPQQEAVISTPEPPKISETKPLTLKAEVKETTWVKIIVDQETPKEYVFQPGSHPEWKARDGFELFIGNAGGIALEFNGKKLDNLGRHGKVIHLKLPRENERSTSE
jgi:cytoskeleton protein RodZ